MNREEFINNRIKEHYDYIKNKYDVVYLGLQGSQNYELDVYEKDYKSDIDTKAIILPSFEDFVYNRQPVSRTVVLDNNEHIDVKDIRTMFDTFKKQNVNFIEILFTKYKIINEEYKDLIQILLNNKEEIARLNKNQALRCMAGMSMEKLKALQHPYPTILDKIIKYGYDPKQLHHILRMNDFIKKYAAGIRYEDCLIPDNKEYLIEIKKGVLNEKEAVELAQKTDTETKQIKDKYITEKDIASEYAIEILNKVKLDILTRKFKKQLLES